MASSRYKTGDRPIPRADYRLVQFIARGGFGEVWKATAPGGKEVALKIIDLTNSQSVLEVKALKSYTKLSHPYLNELQAFWQKDQHGNLIGEDSPAESSFALTTSERLDVTQAFDFPRPVELILAITLCDATLFKCMESYREDGLPGIPVEELLQYFTQAGAALTYLHNYRTSDGTLSPILHRDIKPQNLMTRSGMLQICDFGLVRTVDDLARTENGPAVSPPYASPESFHGDYSVQTDLYSLAISYYELRMGELPFERADLDKHREKRLTAVAVYEIHRGGRLCFDRVPEPERQVLKQATRVDPAQRYKSVQEFVETLQAAVTSQVAPVSKHFEAAVSVSTVNTDRREELVDQGTLQVEGIGLLEEVRRNRQEDFHAGSRDSLITGQAATDEQTQRGTDTKGSESARTRVDQTVVAKKSGASRPKRFPTRFVVGALILLAGSGGAALFLNRDEIATPSIVEAPELPQARVRKLIEQRKFTEAHGQLSLAELAANREVLSKELHDAWRGDIERSTAEGRHEAALIELRSFASQPEFAGEATLLRSNLRESWLNHVFHFFEQPLVAKQSLEQFRTATEFADDDEAVLQQARLQFVSEGVEGLRKSPPLPTAWKCPHPETVENLARRLKLIAQPEGDLKEFTALKSMLAEFQEVAALKLSVPVARLAPTAYELEEFEKRRGRFIEQIVRWGAEHEGLEIVDLWGAVGSEQIESTDQAWKWRHKVVEHYLSNGQTSDARVTLAAADEHLDSALYPAKVRHAVLKKYVNWCDSKEALKSVPTVGDVEVALQEQSPSLKAGLTSALVLRADKDTEHAQKWSGVVQLLIDNVKDKQSPEYARLSLMHARSLTAEVRRQIVEAGDKDKNDPAWYALRDQCQKLRSVLTGPTPAWLSACEMECLLHLPEGVKPAGLSAFAGAEPGKDPYADFVHARVLKGSAGADYAAIMRCLAAAYPAQVTTVAGITTDQQWQRAALDGSSRRKEAALIFSDSAKRLCRPVSGLSGDFEASLQKAFASNADALSVSQWYQSARELTGGPLSTARARFNQGLAQYCNQDYASALETFALLPFQQEHGQELSHGELALGSLGLALAAVKLEAAGKLSAENRRVLAAGVIHLPTAFQNDPRNDASLAVRLEAKVLRPLGTIAQAEKGTFGRDFAFAYAKFLAKYRAANWEFPGGRLAKMRSLLEEQALPCSGPSDQEFRARCYVELGYNELNFPEEGSLDRALTYAAAAAKFNPQSGRVLGLQGYARLRSARVQLQAPQMLQEFQEAVSLCEQATKSQDAQPEDTALGCIYWSMSLLEQANYISRFSEKQEELDQRQQMFSEAVRVARIAATSEDSESPNILLKANALKAEGNATEDLAWILRVDMAENFASACNVFDEALELAPTDPDFLAAKGRCYYRCAAESLPLGDDELVQVTDQLREQVSPKGREGLAQTAQRCLEQALVHAPGHLEALEFSGRWAAWKALEAKKFDSAEFDRLVKQAEGFWLRGFRSALEQRNTTYLLLFSGLLSAYRQPGFKTTPDSLFNELKQVLKSPQELPATAYCEPSLDWAYLEAEALRAKDKRAAWEAVKLALDTAPRREVLSQSARRLNLLGMELVLELSLTYKNARITDDLERQRHSDRLAWDEVALQAMRDRGALPSELAKGYWFAATAEANSSEPLGYIDELKSANLKKRLDYADKLLAAQQEMPPGKSMSPPAWNSCWVRCKWTTDLLTEHAAHVTPNEQSQYRTGAATNLDFAFKKLNQADPQTLSQLETLRKDLQRFQNVFTPAP